MFNGANGWRTRASTLWRMDWLKVTSFAQGILSHVVGLIAAKLLRIWSNSWRSDAAQMGKIDQLIADGERVILVVWHGKYLPLFALAEGRHAVVFTSESFRGKVISQICTGFGYDAVQIPSLGQNGSRLRHMELALKSTTIGVIVVDGPLGPYHQVKPGVIKLASILGYLIVPVSVTCDPKRVMTERWDKRELPNWHAKVALAVGDPIRIPAGLEVGKIKVWTRKIRFILEKCDQQADVDFPQKDGPQLFDSGV